MCQTVGVADQPNTSPGPGARRRGGRRPGSSRSRQKIVKVARVAFPANGYAETSLRGIAREAGVDPSLIVQLFGSKAGLFAAVVEWPFDASEVATQIRDVPAGKVGEYMARTFIGHWDRDEHRNPIVSLIYAALSDSAAAAMLRDFITVNFALPVVERGDADRPEAPCRPACLTAHRVRSVPVCPRLRRARLGARRRTDRRARRDPAAHVHRSAQLGPGVTPGDAFSRSSRRVCVAGRATPAGARQPRGLPREARPRTGARLRVRVGSAAGARSRTR